MTKSTPHDVSWDRRRRDHVNTKELKGGEVPPSDAKSPEALARHVEAMVCSFWNWPGNMDMCNAELVYTVALGALRKMQSVIEEQRGPQ